MSLFPRPRPRPTRPFARRFTALAAALLLAGCAADMAHRDGLKLASAGQAQESLRALQRATDLSPDNARYRIDYLEQRERTLQQMLLRADELRLRGEWDAALQAYREMMRLDGNHPRALAGLLAADAGQRAAALAARDEAAAPAAKAAATPPPAALPRLDSALLDRRLTVRLRDVPLRLVLDSIAGATGLKFVPDRDVRTDQRSTLFLSEARLSEVLDLLAVSNQLAMRPMDDHTVLIYPDTPAKRRDYAELQTRTFVLKHADAAAIATLLKTMLKSQLLVSDAHGNTLVLRDTPDVLRVAEQIIAANDLPVGDVMIEVQVVEVSRQRLSQLGVGWPDSLSLSTPADVATVGALRALGGDAWLASPLALSLNLQLQDIDANIIANPSVRARHKEKARLMIGDKVPVITNQASQSGVAGEASAAPAGGLADATGQANANADMGGSGQTTFTGSVQYIDVGLKLEVEPQLYGDGDIGLAVNLELSQISKTLNSASGVVYQVGTRQAQTSMRLRDGETQWLGGLINHQERVTTSGLPGLSGLPVLGRLFGVDRKDHSETELLLAITPRRVRDRAGLPAGPVLIDSGDEGRVRARALDVRSPAGDNSATPSQPLPDIEIAGQTLRNSNMAGQRGAVAPIGLPDGVKAMPSEMPGVPVVVPRRVPNAVPRQSDEAAPR